MSDTILMERKDSVVYLTLNRPEALNAINRELGNALLGHLKDCEEDDSVRAVVLRRRLRRGRDLHCERHVCALGLHRGDLPGR